MTRVYLIGLPGQIGGASTEAWHAVRLWRVLGCQVTVIPTWYDDPLWRRKLEAIGIRVLALEKPECLRTLSELRGAVVVGICSGAFLQYAPWLKAAGAKLVWIGCMNAVWGNEKTFFHAHGPFDAYVYQSQFQYAVVTRELRAIGVPMDRFVRIPGSFTCDEFPYRPRTHMPGDPFVVGRLARPDPDKWHVDTWATYAAIPYRPIQAAMMGWTGAIERKLGVPPDWAMTLMPCGETTPEFLARLHCLFPINGPFTENWPQVGLEAMATGVPIVAQRAGGWPEMVEHGVTGFLSESLAELADLANVLAEDDSLRGAMARRAHERLLDELANPNQMAEQWQTLFDRISN
ncbi:MAG: glycosyltransferase family 4 protein [Pirellulales bacterium]